MVPFLNSLGKKRSRLCRAPTADDSVRRRQFRHALGLWPRIGWVQSRGVSRTAGLSNVALPRLSESNKETAHEQTRYYLPRGSCGSSRHPGTSRGLRTLRRSPGCERSDVALYPRHSFRGVHECEGSDALTGAAFARGARSSFRGPEQV